MLTQLGKLLVEQARERQESLHGIATNANFALTKYAEVMDKLAAKWHDMFANLSPVNKARILQSGIAKTPDQIADGINRGTRRMMKQIGYTESDISRPTPAQIHTAKKRTQKQILHALRMGDKAAVERNLATLRMFKTPIGKISTGNDIFEAQAVPELKMMFTANPGQNAPQYDRLANATIRRHELYEGQSAEREAHNFYSNKTRMREANKQKINRYVNNITDVENLSAHDRIALRKWMLRNQLHDKSNLALDQDLAISSYSNRPGQMIASYKPLTGYEEIGSHNDLDVLVKERKLLDRIPYQTYGLQTLRNIRNKRGGEYEYMDSASGYTPENTIERFNKINSKNLYRNSRNPVTTTFGSVVKPFW